MLLAPAAYHLRLFTARYDNWCRLQPADCTKRDARRALGGKRRSVVDARLEVEAILVAKAGVLGHHVEGFLRRTMRRMQPCLPLADRLLAHFQFVGHLALCQPHVLAQRPNRVGFPGVFGLAAPLRFWLTFAHTCPRASTYDTKLIAVIVTRQRSEERRVGKE